MSEVIHAGGLVFVTRRSARRTTLGLTVGRGGDLIVHAPDGIEGAEIRDFVQSRLLWAHRKLAETEPLRIRHRPPEFVTGETIFYLGKSHRLRVTEGVPECLAFDGTEFLLERAIKDPFPVFRAWFIRHAAPFINARVEWFQRRTTSVPRGIRVCDLGFRWGSCGPTGHLNFNWQLVQFPVRMIDYVVAHEMTHLAVPNHSKTFWRSLGSMLPDYAERRDELAAHAHRFLRFQTLPPESRTSAPLGGHNPGVASFCPDPSLPHHTHQP